MSQRANENFFPPFFFFASSVNIDVKENLITAEAKEGEEAKKEKVLQFGNSENKQSSALDVLRSHR